MTTLESSSCRNDDNDDQFDILLNDSHKKKMKFSVPKRKFGKCFKAFVIIGCVSIVVLLVTISLSKSTPAVAVNNLIHHLPFLSNDFEFGEISFKKSEGNIIFKNKDNGAIYLKINIPYQFRKR